MLYLEEDVGDDVPLDAEGVAAIEAIDQIEDSIKSGGVLARLLLDAKKSSDRARDQLVSVDPTDSRMIMRLQWEVSRFDALMDWIIDVRDTAEAALSEFSESDQALVRAIIKGEPEVKDA